MDKSYDLHVHSIHSDGTDTVEELMKRAVQRGLCGLSITDHDTLSAYKEAFIVAKHYQLLLLPGVEITTVYQGNSVHLLAYSFSPKNEIFLSLMYSLQEIRTRRNIEILDKLKKQGMALDLEKLKEDIGVIGRPHIANALFTQGYVSSPREAFDRLIGEGKLCYAPGARIEIEQVIEQLHRARAFAILAHPHLFKNRALEDDLIRLPLDGLEVHYANLNIEHEKKWKKICQEKGWIRTGGSDYHGRNKAHIELGASYTKEETFQILWKRYQENEHL